MAFQRMVALTRLRGTSKGKAMQILFIASFLSIFVVSSISVPWSLQPSQPRTSTQSPPPSGNYFDHIVTIIIENQGIQNICGRNPPPCNGSNSPFLSTIGNNFALATQYNSVNPGGSQPNYVGLIGGSTFNCGIDSCPANINATNLVDSLERAGLTWKAYMENQTITTGCDLATAPVYEHEHNPFVSFANIVNNSTRCQNIVLANPSLNATCTTTDCTLINDLNSNFAANFMWLTPNDCNNMHGGSLGVCPYSSPTSIVTGDDYLKSLVPNILKSRTFNTTRSALFIVFDEGTNFCPVNPGIKEDCVYAVWAGSAGVTKMNFVSSNFYNDYSYLRTIESNWKLPTLTANDAAASPMAEFFAGQQSVKLVSWNPRVPCTPLVETVEQIIGNQTNTKGGASESGSVFSPGITNSTYGPDNTKSWLSNSTSTPPGWKSPGTPCVITNSQGDRISAFVQINGVQRDFINFSASAPSTQFKTINGGTTYPNGAQSDSSFNILTPGYGTASTNCQSGNATADCMHSLSVTIDKDWKGSAYCGAYTACDDTSDYNGLVNRTQAYKSLIDVQGFVFWNPALNSSSHNFSGWELHPFTAWRESTTAPDFVLSASPKTQTILPGTSAFYNVTVNTIKLFTGSISLSATISSSSGATGPTPTLKMVPPQVTLPINGKFVAFSQLNVTTAALTSGTYNIIVSGTNGTLTRTTSVTVVMVGFTLSASPPILSVAAGSTLTSTITLTSRGSFNGTVKFTSPQISCNECATGALSLSSLLLKAGGTNQTILTVDGINYGNATLTITASSISPSFSASTIVNVQIYDFSLSAPQRSLTTNAGTAVSTTLPASSLNHFNGTVTFAVSTSPSGPSAILTPASLNLTTDRTLSASLSFNTTVAGTYTVTVTASSGSLSHTVTITVTVVDFSIASTTSVEVNHGSAVTTSIVLTSLNGFANTVLLTNSTSPLPGILVNLSTRSITLTPGGSGSSILTVLASTVGNYTITITGTNGALHHTISIRITVVEFSIVSGAASPTSINVGSMGNSNITVTGVNGFSRNVALSVSSSSPLGLSCSVTPTSLVLPPSPSTSLLTCTASVARDYTVTVTGINGTLSHTTSIITFHFVDFTLAPSKASVTLIAGSGTTGDSLTLASLNSFTGIVTMSVSISPSGPSVQFLDPTVKLPPGGNSTSLTINAGPFAGIFKLNVTGTNGSLIRSTLITLTVTPANPTITTVIKDSNGATATSVTAGTTVHDTATINGGTQSGGTVTYTFFTNGLCTAPGTSASTVSVTNGVVPDSSAFTPVTPGSYSFNATYSGDANNNKASSSCESLNVTSKLTPTLGTTIKDTNGVTVTTVLVGTPVHDTATLSGGSPVITGTITYFFFSNLQCSGPPSTAFAPFPQTVTIGSGNSIPASATLIPGAGPYSFNATYSGDAINNPVTSSCEPLTINKQTPVITTAISPSSTITVGASVTDQATLTGGYPSTGVTGSVTYAFFSNSACNGSPTSSSTVTVGAADSVPPSNSVTPPSAGSFAFNATYSGDTNNSVAKSSCEPLTVNKATPSVTTSINPSSTIVVGTPVSDQVTITGGFPSSGVTGTVTYEFFGVGDGSCIGTPAASQIVTVGSTNSVPSSSPQTPSMAGQYSFNATYNGD